MTEAALRSLLLAPLLGTGVHLHLPLVLLGWMLVLKLPPARRCGTWP